MSYLQLQCKLYVHIQLSIYEWKLPWAIATFSATVTFPPSRPLQSLQPPLAARSFASPCRRHGQVPLATCWLLSIPRFHASGMGLSGIPRAPPRRNDFMRAPALRYTEKHAKLCLYWPCLDVSFWAGCVRHAFPFTLIDCVQLHSNSSWLGRFFRAAWLRSVSVTILPPIRLKVRGFSSIGRSNSASLVAGNKSRGYSKENSQGYHLKSNCADRLIVIESDNFYSIRQLNAPWILFCVLKNSLKVIFRWKVCFQKIFIWRLPGAFENKFWMLWISSSCEKFREENSVKIRNPAPVAGTASTASGKCWLIFKN